MNFYQVISNAKPAGISPRIIQSNLFVSYDPKDPLSFDGGTTLYDLQNNYDLTLQGLMNQNYDSQGWFNTDGINDYADSLGGSIAFASTPFTAAGWFKYNEPNNVDIGFQFGSGTYFGILNYTFNGNLRARWYTSSNNFQTDIYAITTSQWFYVVQTYDPNGSTSDVKAYIGVGGSAVEERYSGTLPFVIPNTTSKSIRLSHPQQQLQGSIGEFHVYDTILSEIEINLNYNNTKERYGY